MSFLWNPVAKKPQPWVFVFFIGLSILFVLIVYQYGMSKAINQAPALEKADREFK